MPIYEYQCDRCQKQFEELRKAADEPLVVCPTCGGPVKRIVSRTSFALKGSGWYKDGYSAQQPSTEKKPSTPPADAPKKDESTVKTGSTTAGDTKKES